MSDSKELTRVQTTITPQLEEDWKRKPGQIFRRTLERVSQFFKTHQVAEKIGHTHDLGWKAAEGAASSQHAKAEENYAKAENERIDTELRRRTMRAKIRQEDAAADKAESEARLSQLAEVRARIELFKSFGEIGVSAKFEADMSLTIAPIPKPAEPLPPSAIIEQLELKEINSSLKPIMFAGWGQKSRYTFVAWHFQCGARVEAGQKLCDITESSPTSATAYNIAIHRSVQAPASGILLETFAEPQDLINIGQMLGMILPDA